MSDTPTFRDKLRAANPEIAERAEAHVIKESLARSLRSIRKSKGIVQTQIEARAEMAQTAVSRLEAPRGALPNLETLRRYLEACGVEMKFDLQEDADGGTFSLVIASGITPDALQMPTTNGAKVELHFTEGAEAEDATPQAVAARLARG